MSQRRPTAYYAAFFLGAWLRRIVAYVSVLYGFEVLGGGMWSGLFYLCLVSPYLLSVYAGSVIDASSKRTVLQICSALPLLLLATMALAEHQAWLGTSASHGWLMAALITGYGVISAFAYPAFLAAIPDVVDRDAIGRTTAMVNVLGMLCHACGPLAVGLLRTYLSWPGLFAALAGLAAVAWAVLPLVPLPRHDAPHAPAESEWTRLRDLTTYCRQHPSLLAILATVGVFAGLVVGPLEVLAPLFAQGPLHCTPFVAGLFIATGGSGLVVGAIIGALRLVDRAHMGAWICGSGAAGAGFMMAMTLVPVPVAFLLFFLGGLLGGVFSSLSIAGIQARASDALRGRVLGLFSLILGATPALGGLVSGALVSRLGAAATMRVVFAAVAVAFALLYVLQPTLREAQPGDSRRG